MYVIEQLGYQCEKHDNPADFFLDVISTSKTSEGIECVCVCVCACVCTCVHVAGSENHASLIAHIRRVLRVGV